MAKSKGISKTELQALVAAEIASALGDTNSTTLANERSKALDYYLARPFGNEQEGRSSVVSTDVRDTVEWMMPTIIRMFTAGDDTVEYEPVGPGDEALAKQATEYGNFIWMRDNQGFLNYYTWFKDALISKNGIIKIWWDDSEREKRERYYGLDDQAFAALVNLDEVTVSEHTERQETMPGPVDPQTGQPSPPMPMTVHDVVVTRTMPGGKVCVVPVPPEEFLISRDGRNIKDARMVGHRVRTTLSDLRQEGVDEETLAKIGGTDDDSGSAVQEEIARDTVEDGTAQGGTTPNPAMSIIWKTECYIKADVDGDGIAEMRKVTVAGPGNVMIDDEPWDSRRPFASLTPVIMPHRFWGLSVADLIMDLQLIRSSIFRQYLDNLYLSNNQRHEVVEKNIIDPTEVLTSRPGGVVRVKEAGSVIPIVVPQIGAAALEGLTYIDRVRENRTGVSERTQGVGSNALHDTASGEQMLMSAAMGKIELIARVFAQTGVEDAFKIILGLICRYQNKPRTIRLTDKWVAMDPRGWNEEMDVSISVGMGTGDNQVRLQNAMLLGQAQAAAGAHGMVTPENLMNTATELTKAMGYKNPSRFFTAPKPGQQPPPSPEMAKVQAQAEADKAKLQAQVQSEQARAALDAQMRQIEAKQEYDLETRKMMMEFALRQYQIDQEIILKRQEMAAEFRLDQLQAVANYRLGQQKNEISSRQITSNVKVGGRPG